MGEKVNSDRLPIRLLTECLKERGQRVRNWMNKKHNRNLIHASASTAMYMSRRAVGNMINAKSVNQNEKLVKAFG